MNSAGLTDLTVTLSGTALGTDTVLFSGTSVSSDDLPGAATEEIVSGTEYGQVNINPNAVTGGPDVICSSGWAENLPASNGSTH